LRRRTLGSNVTISAANVAVVVGASLVAVPLLIDRLGLAGYGLWTLIQSLVVYVTTAELGFGPALARFASVHAADRTNVRRMLRAAMVVYAMVGLVVVLAAHLCGPSLVDLFDVPARFRKDAASTVGLMGWVACIALVGAPLAHVMTGLERFVALTATNILGSLAFLGSLVLWLRHDVRLEDAARAAMLQWSVVGLLRAFAMRDVLFSGRGLIPDWRLTREVIGFSARLQIAVLATLLNTQTDRVVIGVVAPASTLGQASIATQVAEAARLLAYAAFSPMASRMAAVFGSDGRGALDRIYGRYSPGWIAGVIGVTAVAVGAARPAVTGWVGTGHDQAAVFACLLLFAYGVGMLPAAGFAYLRALGQPGLEGRFGIYTVVFNLFLTVPLGLLFGAPGVVGATTAAYLVSTVWAVHRIRGHVPAIGVSRRQLLVMGLMAVPATAATYGLGQALTETVPRLVAIAGLAPVSGAVLVAYLATTTGFSPRQVVRSAVQARRAAAAL
jgi:O-antigen/teichoic acid export membrane protein